MKKQKKFQEIFVEFDFLETRLDIIKEVNRVGPTTYKVTMEHPVFGNTVEVFERDSEDNTLCLKSVFASEMQTEEEMEVVKDYYNNFILGGEETYLDYYFRGLGYLLVSRNTGVYA